MPGKRLNIEKVLNKFVGIIDFFLLNLSVLVAYTIRPHLYKFLFSLNINPFQILKSPLTYSISIYIEVAILYSIIMLIIFNSFKLYENRKTFSRLDEAFVIVKSSLLGIAIIIGICYMVRWINFSRSILLLMSFFSILFIVIWRLIIRSIELMLIKQGVGVGRILLYGAGKAGKMIADEIKIHTSWGDALVGFIDDDPEKIGKTIHNGLKVLGCMDYIPELVDRYSINEIIISMPSTSNRRLLEVILFLRDHNIPFKIMPDIFDLITHRIKPQQLGGITIFELMETQLTPGKRFFKRLFDVTISILIFILLLPLWIPIIISIKLSSPGPIFFAQKRIGEGGEVFKILKFRTMVINAEELKEDLEKYNESDGPNFFMRNDPRITKVGRLLRKLSLDEIPQLINVIKGDMSLVGPRPFTPEELEAQEHWHLKRLNAPQGITGLWQVSGRNDLSFNEMVKLDIFYIENWSLWLDLKIFLRTIPSVFFMRGAY